MSESTRDSTERPFAELLDRREIFRGRTVRLTVDHVRMPNGEEVNLERIHHVGAAAVLPLLPNGDVVLVRQVRWTTGGWLLEIPAGKLDPGERPEQCALRELAEEAGLEAGHLESLGAIWPTPGFADEKIWLFLATELTVVPQRLESDEVLELVQMPLAEAIHRAACGEIEDAKSVCALLRAASRSNE
jgi:ADP-ribose pyrophosphatase